MGFQRARTDTQIQKRQMEIITAAAQIYDEGGHEAVNFTAISERTKFTRPTIYKYYATKEAILLSILIEDVKVWVDDLLSQFKLNRVYSTKDISIIWANILAKHQRLNSLHAILYTILERNVSTEVMIEFKKDLFSTVMPLQGLMAQLFPNATMDGLQHFMMQQYAISSGFYSVCHLTPRQLNAMKALQPEYEPMDFATEFQIAILPHMEALE